jgi:3-deoxy-manno-octulosonate cytidylyltransferase (CMP-KDO synthetase)
MKIVGIIPSRLESTRLPEKALVDIEGLPMIAHVFKRSQMAAVLDDVIVATDSRKIFDVIAGLGGKAVMTSDKHQTGTDRIAEAAKNLEADIIVNIQGDEALLDPKNINRAVKALIQDPASNMTVLVTPYTKRNSLSDIKAVLDKNNHVLFCSRNDLPSEALHKTDYLWKMCFLVPMRKSFLMKFASWPKSFLEEIESIEHLRVLENGEKINAVPVPHAHISVDTAEDLEEIRKFMRTDVLKKQYLDRARWTSS